MGRNIITGIGNIIHQNNFFSKDEDKVRLTDFFASQVSNNNIYNTEYNYSSIKNCDTAFNFPFVTKTMILDIIKNIKIDTANGPDNISNIFIKKTKNTLYLAYEYIFNYSFIHGVYPTQWKESCWTPLYKKGSKFNGKITDQYL